MMSLSFFRRASWRNVSAALALCLISLPATAQFNPAAGDWGKTDPSDLRVMTWNVEDGLCSTNAKAAGLTNWEALARIVASFQPDVLLLQECADNSGNGTGSGADSVSTLETVLDLFMHGGNDPFNGGAAVAAYVQLYAPSYDMPFVFVTGITDGFNRNVIMSRYPFADLNGDGVDQLNDFLQLGDLYSPGVNGGIRGFMHAEIDLPDSIYAGDLVIGNSHLKAGGGSSNHNQRVAAGQNIAYYIDAMFNGLGGGVADPNSKILSPAATTLVSADTVVMAGGDWNEHEGVFGKGPASWITRAAVTGGTDGTDRDGSDMTYDDSAEFFTGNKSTQSSSKLDYISWQDSIATLRNSFIFNSTAVVPTNLMPPELAGFFINPQLASGIASDHRPVIADFQLPLTGGCVSVATDLGNGLAGTGGLGACPRSLWRSVHRRHRRLQPDRRPARRPGLPGLLAQLGLRAVLRWHPRARSGLPHRPPDHGRQRRGAGGVRARWRRSRPLRRLRTVRDGRRWRGRWPLHVQRHPGPLPALSWSRSRQGLDEALPRQISHDGAPLPVGHPWPAGVSAPSS